VAHAIARAAVPNADPYLLPIAGLLTAIGLTEIYRLGPTDAFKQGLWIVIGVASSRSRSSGCAGLPRARAVQVPLRRRRDRTALPAPLPGDRNDRQRCALWVHIGGFTFQPGELAKIFLIVFLAGYLRDKREVLAQGRLKDFGPLLVIWGATMLVLVETNDLGSAFLYFGIFIAMLYIATARCSTSSPGSCSS
jgi:cell division protein FtsW (lipid II flippase)